MEQQDEEQQQQQLQPSSIPLDLIQGIAAEHPGLTTLNLEGNNVQRIENLGALVSLQRLNLCNNRIRLLDNLEQLTALQELRLSNNLIEDIAPSISRLVQLSALDLSSNRLALGPWVQLLSTLPSLQRLSLQGNSISTLPRYRPLIAALLPALTQLDDEPMDPAPDPGPGPSTLSQRGPAERMDEPHTFLTRQTMQARQGAPHLSQEGGVEAATRTLGGALRDEAGGARGAELHQQHGLEDQGGDEDDADVDWGSDPGEVSGRQLRSTRGPLLDPAGAAQQKGTRQRRQAMGTERGGLQQQGMYSTRHLPPSSHPRQQPRPQQQQQQRARRRTQGPSGNEGPSAPSSSDAGFHRAGGPEEGAGGDPPWLAMLPAIGAAAAAGAGAAVVLMQDEAGRWIKKSQQQHQHQQQHQQQQLRRQGGQQQEGQRDVQVAWLTEQVEAQRVKMREVQQVLKRAAAAEIGGGQATGPVLAAGGSRPLDLLPQSQSSSAAQAEASMLRLLQQQQLQHHHQQQQQQQIPATSAAGAGAAVSVPLHQGAGQGLDRAAWQAQVAAIQAQFQEVQELVEVLHQQLGAQRRSASFHQLQAQQAAEQAAAAEARAAAAESRAVTAEAHAASASERAAAAEGRAEAADAQAVAAEGRAVAAEARAVAAEPSTQQLQEAAAGRQAAALHALAQEQEQAWRLRARLLEQALRRMQGLAAKISSAASQLGHAKRRVFRGSSGEEAKAEVPAAMLPSGRPSVSGAGSPEGEGGGEGRQGRKPEGSRQQGGGGAAAGAARSNEDAAPRPAGEGVAAGAVAAGGEVAGGPSAGGAAAAGSAAGDGVAAAAVALVPVLRGELQRLVGERDELLQLLMQERSKRVALEAQQQHPEQQQRQQQQQRYGSSDMPVLQGPPGPASQAPRAAVLEQAPAVRGHVPAAGGGQGGLDGTAEPRQLTPPGVAVQQGEDAGKVAGSHSRIDSSEVEFLKQERDVLQRELAVQREAVRNLQAALEQQLSGREEAESKLRSEWAALAQEQLAGEREAGEKLAATLSEERRRAATAEREAAKALAVGRQLERQLQRLQEGGMGSGVGLRVSELEAALEARDLALRAARRERNAALAALRAHGVAVLLPSREVEEGVAGAGGGRAAGGAAAQLQQPVLQQAAAQAGRKVGSSSVPAQRRRRSSSSSDSSGGQARPGIAGQPAQGALAPAAAAGSPAVSLGLRLISVGRNRQPQDSSPATTTATLQAAPHPPLNPTHSSQHSASSTPSHLTAVQTRSPAPPSGPEFPVSRSCSSSSCSSSSSSMWIQATHQAAALAVQAVEDTAASVRRK